VVLRTWYDAIGTILQNLIYRLKLRKALRKREQEGDAAAEVPSLTD
jgi:hypothetical protein